MSVQNSAGIYRVVTLAAGETLAIPTNGGRRVRVKESTGVAGDFWVKFDDNEFLPLDLATEAQCEGDDAFTRLTAMNRGSSSITVGIYIGFIKIIDDRFNVVSSQTVYVQPTNKTTTIAGGSTTLAAGATEAIAATSGANALKSWVVCNNEAAGSGNVIQILVGAAVVYTVQPQFALQIESNQAVTVKNPNAGAVSLNIAKTYYA